MIIGNGDIAQVLTDREGILFFASGVSNSSCEDESEFIRELNLLYEVGRTHTCTVYFSTISIYDKDTPYTRHKRKMEFVVRTLFTNYCIIRIGNIDWGTNPNTFLNYLREKIKKGHDYEIRDENKYMISKEQLTLVTNSVPLIGKNEICVFGYKAKVKDLL